MNLQQYHHHPINGVYPGYRIHAPANPHPRVVEFVLENNLENSTTSWENPNPKMFEHMMAKVADGIEDINWKYLSANEHPEAIEMFRQSPEKIYWPNFLTNAGIFTQRPDPETMKILAW